MIIDFDRLLLSLIDLSRQVSDWHNNHMRTGASRRKGYTNLENLTNLAKREKSRSSLYLSTVELIEIMVFRIAEEKAKLKKLQLEEKKKNAEFRTKVQQKLSKGKVSY